MEKPKVADRCPVSIVLWIAGAALVAIAVLVVALSRARVADEVIAGVAAACVTGAISVVLAIVNLLDRQREQQERGAALDREAKERASARQTDAEERTRTREAEEKERTRTRQEENVLQALQYFTGKTQRRNVGIAIVEGYWHSVPTLRGILVPLLVNQAVYLLEQSKEINDRHEADNCSRIVNLLVISSDTDPNIAHYYRELLASVERRLAPEEASTEERHGVQVSQATLEQWATKLREKLG
jgi:hypothetical protein